MRSGSPPKRISLGQFLIEADLRRNSSSSNGSNSASTAIVVAVEADHRRNSSNIAETAAEPLATDVEPPGAEEVAETAAEPPATDVEPPGAEEVSETAAEASFSLVSCLTCSRCAKVSVHNSISLSAHSSLVQRPASSRSVTSSWLPLSTRWFSTWKMSCSFDSKETLQFLQLCDGFLPKQQVCFSGQLWHHQ